MPGFLLRPLGCHVHYSHDGLPQLCRAHNDPGGHMDGFLEACGDLSFSALVEKDEEIGSSSPPKAKKRKKDKKEKKGKKTLKVEKELVGDKDQELMADKASKLPAEEDPDEIWPEHLPRPPPLDPYLLGVAEEAPSDEDEEKPSKRAMQRALQGFSRKSGGWKHKKRGSGKGPLGKGRGKKCRYCANSFHQVTVLFLEFSAGFVIMSSFAAGMFLKTWFGFFASPRCRAMSDDPRRGADGPGRSRANEKARAWSDRRSRVARHVAWAFTVQAPRLPWGILLLLVLLPQPRATAAAVMALMRLTTRRRRRRLRKGGGLGAGAEAEIVVVVVLSRGALRRRCRPKGLRFQASTAAQAGGAEEFGQQFGRVFEGRHRGGAWTCSRVCRFPGLGGAEANWRRPCVASGEGWQPQPQSCQHLAEPSPGLNRPSEHRPGSRAKQPSALTLSSRTSK